MATLPALHAPTTRHQILTVGVLLAAFALARTAVFVQLVTTPLAADKFFRANWPPLDMSMQIETVPLSFLYYGGCFFVRSLPEAPFATMLMQSFGRPRVFYAGCFLGVFGALVNAWATYIHHHGDFWKPFILLSLGSLFMGFSNGIGNLFRFAAADVVPEHKRSFAISAVLFGTVFSLSTQLTAAGGDLAALSGPPLALWAKNQLWDFGASYLCVAALYLCCFVVLLFVTLPDFTTPEQSRKEPRSLCQLFTNPKLVLALGTGTISFGCMVLLMTLVPLVINGNFDEGMFLPSLFVGFIIQKIGLLATDCVGLFIMIVGSLVMPMIGNQYWTFVLGLFLCGFGWNLSFVSSTTMLTECYFPSEKAKTQGINDFIMYFVVSTFALFAGEIRRLLEWDATHYMVIVLCASGIVGAVAIASWEYKQVKDKNLHDQV